MALITRGRAAAVGAALASVVLTGTPVAGASADVTPPDVPWATDGQRHTLASTQLFSWVTSDLESNVASYDVRYSVSAQTASRMSQRWRSTPALARTTARTVRLRVPRGKIVCVQARAYDDAGNVSAWGNVGCTARAYDDRQVLRKGTVKKVRDRRYYGGVASRLKGEGRLVLRGVEAGSAVYVVYKQTRKMGAGLLYPRGDTRYVFGERGPATFKAVWFFHDPVERSGRLRVLASAPGSIVIDGVAVVPRWAW
ncbi:hypothetical protein [Mumia sp. DW29H23]|uniref:hypothetical protein n=1 Tax=Mumia sp. DW29H23 TaxID=3421241 RepID=UPI003D692962